MNNKQKNLDRVISLLMKHKDGITIQQIAEKLACNPSTVHRYIQELMDEGYDIEQLGRGYYYLKVTKSQAHILLRPKEALMIYLALRRYIRQTSRAPHFLISALYRIADALQREDLVKMLRESVMYLEKERPMSEQHNSVWEMLIEAWLTGRVIAIEYQKARQNDVDTYVIEPYWFEPAILSDGTYLIAYSHNRADLRTFKTDRIRDVRFLDETYQRPDELGVLTLLKHSWGIWYGQEDIHQVFELRFPPHVANRIMEQVFHPNEEKVLQPDGSVLWRAKLAGELEILSWVRSWGPDVQVLAPEKFKERVIADLRHALNIYLDHD